MKSRNSCLCKWKSQFWESIVWVLEFVNVLYFTCLFFCDDSMDYTHLSTFFFFFCQGFMIKKKFRMRSVKKKKKTQLILCKALKTLASEEHLMGSNPSSFTSSMCVLGQVTLITFSFNFSICSKRMVIVPALQFEV